MFLLIWTDSMSDLWRFMFFLICTDFVSDLWRFMFLLISCSQSINICRKPCPMPAGPAAHSAPCRRRRQWWHASARCRRRCRRPWPASWCCLRRCTPAGRPARWPPWRWPWTGWDTCSASRRLWCAACSGVMGVGWWVMGVGWWVMGVGCWVITIHLHTVKIDLKCTLFHLIKHLISYLCKQVLPSVVYNACLFRRLDTLSAGRRCENRE